MSLEGFRRRLAGFNNKHWLFRYLIIMACVYIPMVFLTHRAGRLAPNPETDCEVTFVYDYTWHFSWVFVIPFSVVILPWSCRTIERAVDVLRESLAKKTEEQDREHAPGSRQLDGYLGTYWFQLVAGACAGLLVSAGVGINTVRTTALQNRANLLWWFPYDRSYGIFLYNITIAGIVTTVGFGFLLWYANKIRIINRIVRDSTEIPTWIASQGGPIDALFRSVFLLFLPASTLSLCLILNRLLRGLAFSDFAVLFNIVMVASAVPVLLIWPVFYSGLPAKLRRQRAELLGQTEKKIAEILSQLKVTGHDDDRKQLFDRLGHLSKEKMLIMKNHPVWPLGFGTKILSGVPIVLSTAPSAITVLTVAVRFVVALR